MSNYVASARVKLPDPVSIVEEMCLHFEEHGRFVTTDSGVFTVAAPLGIAIITPENDGITIEIKADTLGELLFFRSDIVLHLIEFAKEASPDIVPEFEWTGDGDSLSAPPNFRLIEVISSRDVSPHMRRITFKVEDIARFDDDNDFHVRLFLPRDNNIEPEWPSFGKNGVVRYARGERAPSLRTYTVRQVDRAAGTVDIDFVLHEHSGPASTFAKSAQAGDIIGMQGPMGGAILLGLDWYLLACDETGLPALARALEQMPEQAKGVAFIEVRDTLDEQPIDTRSGIEVRWLHRNGATPGTTNLLTDAVRETGLPTDGSSIYVWTAAEYETFRSVRLYLRNELGLRRDQYQVVSYWRKGKAEVTTNLHDRSGGDKPM